MITVEFTRDEYILAASVGAQRTYDNYIKRIKEKYGSNREVDGAMNDFTGARGEAALAKWLGVPWDGSPGDYTSDVGKLFQVRSSEYATAHLILHDADLELHPNAPFVLAIPTKVISMRLVGWLPIEVALIGGHDSPYFGKGRNKSDYWLPQEILWPMEGFKDAYSAEIKMLRKEA